MIYIDTCVLMLFIDTKDPLRPEGTRWKKIEKVLKKNVKQIAVPMPAFGEAFCKIRDKAGERISEVREEMDRLIKDHYIEIRYLKEGSDLFGIAASLSKKDNDDRNNVSPMDALILASALVDKECTTFITTDTTLLMNSEILEIANNWRNENNLPDIKIADLNTILKL